MLIFGDTAGQYDAFVKLIADHRTDEELVILAGDIVDRGPKSREMIEWAKNDDNSIVLIGNHEHMMIDWVFEKGVYDVRDWRSNGGIATVHSYFPDEDSYVDGDNARAAMRQDALWLECQPFYFYRAGLIVTHAPPLMPDKLPSDIDRFLRHPDGRLAFVWNRRVVTAEDFTGKHLHLYGHNSQEGLRVTNKGGKPVAICLDTTWAKKVTAYRWPEGDVLQQPYL